MNRRAGVRTLAVLGAVIWAPSALAEPLPPVMAEREQVRRVHLPVVLDSRAPDACDGVTADAIEVVEDGLHLPALHLDDRRMPAEHALLVDSSESMVERLREVKGAALDYVDALPADEPALVASFDDDLILYGPMNADRAALHRNAEVMFTGWQTRLWAGVRRMVAYLASRDRRTVLIVLSDGCDTDSWSGTGFREVVDAVARVPALKIYTIGLDLPPQCEGAATDPRVELAALARATGGDHVDIDSPREMRGVLRDIREKLDSERYVSYAPPPFGAGPEDRVESGERRRHVAVRWRTEQPGCRLRLAAGPTRLERAARRDDEAAAAAFAYDPATRTVGGSVHDVLADGGPLSRRDILGNVRLEVAREPQTGIRKVAAPVPPLERVAWRGARPEYALFFALMQLGAMGDAAAAGGAEAGLHSWIDAPFLVQGDTLLDRRLALGAALAGQPDYRAWAVERLRARRLADVDEVAAEIDDDAARAALGAVRGYIESEDWRPGADELAPYLGEWLGDVPALRLHRAAEAWLAQRLLSQARATGAPLARELLAADERLWRDVGLLLGEQRAVRVFGLLVPGYDPVLDRIGFYRIVLPRPTTLVNVFHVSPDAPRGLQLLDWALRQPQAAAAFEAAPFEVVAVQYQSLGRTAPQVLDLAGIEAPKVDPSPHGVRVELELVTRDAERERARLRAVFAFRDFAGVPPSEPLCLEFQRGQAQGPRATKLLGDLLEAKASSALPCVVPSEGL